MAKVPNFEAALVVETKLTGYLLSPSHPDGSPKARFLRRFGFARDDPDTLRQALLLHIQAHDVVATRPTDYGTLYEVVGRLMSPDGRNPLVRVIWMIDHGTDTPRLITLIPKHEVAS